MQLVGTVFFNVSTFAALDASLGAAKANRYVWRPDAFGSICFLVASELAFAEVGHRWISWRPRLRVVVDRRAEPRRVDRVRRLRGRAPTSFPSSGEPRNVELVNLGTFVGAIGFLVGAFLLLPERTDPVDTDPVQPLPST